MSRSAIKSVATSSVSTSVNTSDRFIYFLVAEDNAGLLKEELSKCMPQLKLSYSRKTFLTYKDTKREIAPGDDLGIVFAYSYGVSLGKSNRAQLVERVRECLENPIFKGKPIFNSFLCKEEALAVERELGDRFKKRAFVDGDLVLELVRSFEDEYFIGVHAYGPCRTVLGDYSQPEVPSRAYFKIREAVSLLGLTLKAGQSVLDIGASPGGASYYFLQEGCRVLSVDPKEMHPLCTRNPNFEHTRLSIEALSRSHLAGRKFDWMAVDVNLDPLYLTHELERILAFMPRPSLGMFFTVKQTRNFSRERIPEFIGIIKSLGFKRVVVRQVPSNRSEFLLFASG